MQTGDSEIFNGNGISVLLAIFNPRQGSSSQISVIDGKESQILQCMFCLFSEKTEQPIAVKIARTL